MKDHTRRRLVAVFTLCSAALWLSSCKDTGEEAADATGPSPTRIVEDTPRPMSEVQKLARGREIAQRVVEACGGLERWEDIRYLTFEYFSGRRHTWDKEKNLLRLDMPSSLERPNGVLVDLNTKTGRTWNGGAEVIDELMNDHFVGNAIRYFQNDLAWIFLPFLLVDSAYSVRYDGPGKTADGKPAELLDVFYQGPTAADSRHYIAYIDPETHLILQWDFFSRISDQDPRIVCPWIEWKEIDGLMVSTSRGVIENQDVSFSDIAVLDELPETVFTRFTPIPEFIREFKAAEE